MKYPHFKVGTLLRDKDIKDLGIVIECKSDIGRYCYYLTVIWQKERLFPRLHYTIDKKAKEFFKNIEVLTK